MFRIQSHKSRAFKTPPLLINGELISSTGRRAVPAGIYSFNVDMWSYGGRGGDGASGAGGQGGGSSGYCGFTDVSVSPGDIVDFVVGTEVSPTLYSTGSAGAGSPGFDVTPVGSTYTTGPTFTNPSSCEFNPGSNQIVILDDGTPESLQNFQWDGSVWSQVAAETSLPPNSYSTAQICWIDTDRIAIWYYESTPPNGILVTYEFDGTTWTQVGNALTVSDSGSVIARGLCRLDTNLVAVSSNGIYKIRAYSFDGTDWSNVGTDYTLDSSWNAPYLYRVADNRVAVVATVINNKIQTFEFNGSTWSPVGNVADPIPGSSAAQVVDGCSLYENTIALALNTDEEINILAFDGTDWTQSGYSYSLGSVGKPLVVTLDDKTLAWYDTTSYDIRTIEVTTGRGGLASGGDTNIAGSTGLQNVTTTGGDGGDAPSSGGLGGAGGLNGNPGDSGDSPGGGGGGAGNGSAGGLGGIGGIKFSWEGWYLGASQAKGSKSISSTADGPLSMRITRDGSIVYVYNASNQTVYQFTLSTPWDVTTATYASKSFSVAAQGGSGNEGIFVSSDGVKLYYVNSGNDTVFQYTMSSPFDISTASYDSVSYSVSAQISNPTSVFFSEDGTKMYVGTPAGTNTVRQYTLSSAWNVSTASFASKVLNEGVITADDVWIDSTGTKVVMTGFQAGDPSCILYELSTPWDISTGTTNSVSLVLSASNSVPRGAALNDSGTKLVACLFATDTLLSFDIGQSP